MRLISYGRIIITLLSVFLLLSDNVSGQARKPEVLVYGDGIDAFTAAIQSAKSKLHTVWITERPDLRSSMSLEPTVIHSHERLDAGIWADLLAGALGSEMRSDSLSARAKSPLNPQLILNQMEEQIRAYPHLHVYYQPGLRSVQKNRRSWQIRLNDGRRFSVRAVVDATAEGRIATISGVNPTYLNMDSVIHQMSDMNSSADQVLARTGVAVTDLGAGPQILKLAQLIPTTDDNLFFTQHSPAVATLLTNSMEDLPLMAHVGQAVGASAAYVAFYKRSSDKLEVRPIQAEILQFGARLIPYQDIPLTDPHYLPIQRIGAVQLFQTQADTAGAYLFEPDKFVSTREIAPELNALFSRSQIWFSDHPAEELSLEELISLIKYIGHRGDELEPQIQQLWSLRWKFKEDYDLALKITRRHFAVLMDEYLKPFDVRVDLRGQITR